jgi:hypothetical protein
MSGPTQLEASESDLGHSGLSLSYHWPEPTALPPDETATVEPRKRQSAARRRAAAALAVLSVLVLVALEIKAIFNHYEMRVTADTPTFLALIRDLAIHPLRPDSVFFGTANSDSLHASPYLQALALIWRAVAPAGRIADPLALGEFAAVVTIPVTLFVLAMLWLYTRQVAGRTAASAAVPALLAVFGPVHVAFAGDFTLNGFLDTGYFPTTFATGLTLATLMTLRHPGWRRTVASVLLTALTITTDPFNGVVLAGLMILYACVAGRSDRDEIWRIPLVLVAAFSLARAWPQFDTFAAFQASGLPVPGLLLAAVVVPLSSVMALDKLPGPLAFARRALSFPVSAGTERRVAKIGAWSTAVIVVWGLYMLGHWPTGVPVLRSYRLGFYWNDERDRWLLLFLPGVCGLIGLLRLARRRHSLMLLWFCSFFAFGFMGGVVHLATGHQLPLYYRLILVCQVPIAVGVGAFIAHHRSRVAAVLVVATVAGAFAFKAATLLTTSTSTSYFGAPLSTLWQFGKVIPPGSGLVASDPSTSYFIPIATGHRVLTFGIGHADSGAEPVLAESGYELLRNVYVGTQAQAATALRLTWAAGVRWYVVEKYTTLSPPTERLLFGAAYNSLITAPDINRLAAYNSRIAAVAHEVFDNAEFTVYRLDFRRLMQVTSAPASILPRNRPAVVRALRTLAVRRGRTAARVGPLLYRLGVRMVTLSVGELNSTPILTAYGQSMSDGDTVPIAVTSGRWVVDCLPACSAAPASSEIERLGRVLHSDGRFSTIVALGGRP